MTKTGFGTHIAWLSDIHIGAEGELPHGVDVRNNFIRLIRDIAVFEPEVLVLGGDLCRWEGDARVYRWISGILNEISADCRIWVLPGNHDDPALMKQTDGPVSVAGQLPRIELVSSPAGDVRCFLLDSSPGDLDSSQLRWLAAEMDKAEDAAQSGTVAEQLPPLVFIHHPPALMGVPFMDRNYPLKNHRELSALLETRCCWVFSGHYHCDVQRNIGLSTAFASPSAFTAISPLAETHVPDAVPPGWRLIRIDEQGLHTYPRYLYPMP